MPHGEIDVLVQISSSIEPPRTWDLVFLTTQQSPPTSVVFLSIHQTLLIARGQRVFFFFAMVSNAVDTMWFLHSAPNINVVSNSNKRGQTAGVTMHDPLWWQPNGVSTNGVSVKVHRQGNDDNNNTTPLHRQRHRDRHPTKQHSPSTPRAHLSTSFKWHEV